MQELLTGKRRLPGFSGDWVEEAPFCLPNELLQGLTYSPDNIREYGLLVLRSSNVQSGKLVFNDNVFVNRHVDPSNLVQKDDIIICVRNGSSALIGKCAIAKYDYYATWGAFMVCVRSNHNNYLYQVFQSDIIQKQIQGNSNATINQITNADFLKLKIPLPPTLAEQTAIAQILSDMDAEIDALTEKLNKVRNIKQGMMQELLTGRIRLISSETETETVSLTKVIETPKPEPEAITKQPSGHNQQFDDAVMIAGIVNALYSDKYPLGRKKVQKCLYLLRRHQDESTAAFKKKAAGPYADEVRYKGGEPIARSTKYIVTVSTKGKGTTFARGSNISQALGYIQSWGRQMDIQWLIDKLKFKKVDDLELLATVDMAICDLEEAGIPISVGSIKHLIATNAQWQEKLKKQTFSDVNIARAINELETLL